MTLSHKDLQLSFNSITDTKFIRNVFSNFLISSILLVLILIVIFNVNYGNSVSTFLYGYGAVIFYNILTAKYIKEDYEKKNEKFIDSDFGNITRNAGTSKNIEESVNTNYNNNIIKRGQGQVSWEEDSNFEQDINDFLN